MLQYPGWVFWPVISVLQPERQSRAGFNHIKPGEAFRSSICNVGLAYV